MKRIPDKLIHDNRRYISLRIAARVSGYHRDYLGQVIRAKELEAIRLGKSYYVTEEEFLQFVSRRRRRPVESLLRLLEADAPALPRMSTVLMDDYGVVMPVATHVPAFAWNDRATQKRAAPCAESNSRWGAFLRDEAAQTRGIFAAGPFAALRGLWEERVHAILATGLLFFALLLPGFAERGTARALAPAMRHALVISVGFGHTLRTQVNAAIRQNAQMTEGGFVALAAVTLRGGAEVSAATHAAVFQGTDTFAYGTDALWNNVARKTETPIVTVIIAGRAVLGLLGTFGERLLGAMDARTPAAHDDTLRAVTAHKNNSRASGAGFSAVLRRESEDALRKTPRALSEASKTMFFLPRTMRMAIAQTKDALASLARAPVAFFALVPKAHDVQEQPLTQGRVGAFIAVASHDLEAAVRQWLQPEPLTVQPTVLLTDVGLGDAAARTQTAAAFFYTHPSGCLVMNEEHTTPLPGGCAGAFLFSPAVEDEQFLGAPGVMP